MENSRSENIFWRQCRSQSTDKRIPNSGEKFSQKLFNICRQEFSMSTALSGEGSLEAKKSFTHIFCFLVGVQKNFLVLF